MSPLEAARRLMGAGEPTFEDEGGGMDFCALCEAERSIRLSGTGPFPHAPDCPWLNRQQIVAVLEAAEAVAEASREVHDGTMPWNVMATLRRALASP